MHLVTLLAFTTPSLAALATFKPLTTGPSYSVGIPAGSSVSATAPGPLYFSLSAPATYTWVGLGIGASMSGASIFVMYPDGNGNVTLSARAGRGYVQPSADPRLLAGVELLAGSGVSNGVMTANVRCTTCTLRSASSPSSPWIAAWGSTTTSPPGSTSQSFSIRQHGGNDYRAFTFDLTAASLAADTNPFLAAAANSGSGSRISGAATPGATSGGNDASGSSSSSSSSGSKIKDSRRAHGIIMAATVVLLFPIGAIVMRLVGSPWLHGGIQLFGLAALLAGFGVGIWLAQQQDYLFKSSGLLHTVLGTIITGLFLFQPILGILHHLAYKKTGARGIFSQLHIWYGRALMVGGVINGGLGIRLSANVNATWRNVYIVLASVMGTAYIIAVVVKRKGKRTGGPPKVIPWGKRGEFGSP